MIFAQIRDGIIKNIIILNDESMAPLFLKDPEGGPDFDYLKRIDNLAPVPQIFWAYDSGTDTYTMPLSEG